jgi:hypothetical protein
MRIKFSSISAAVCILIYIGAIGVGVYRIYSGINERRRIAKTEFTELTDTASSVGGGDSWKSLSRKRYGARWLNR